MPASVMRRTSLSNGASDPAIMRAVASGSRLGRHRIGRARQDLCLGEIELRHERRPALGRTVLSCAPHCSSALGMAASAPGGARSSQAVR